MDTDLWKLTCKIDYFRTISCGIAIPMLSEMQIPHEIVRKGLISRIPSEFRRAIGSRGKICVFLTIGSFGPRFRWPSAHSKD